MEHLSACAGALVHESKADQPTKPVLTLDHVQNVQELKRGRYSVVLKGDCLQLGGAKQQVAIKVYEKPSLTSKKQKMATREAIVLKYLNSQGVPNITHMWSAYASRDRFHIIMEYCQGGNMLDWLKAQQPHAVSEQWLAMQVAAPLLRTLAAMHAVGVTHRDVKLENIFMDANGAVKLGDFDLAVFHHEAQARAPVGTIFYMAPEVLLLASYKGSPLEAAVSRRVGEKMDIWSLGVCLFELAAGYKPFQGVSYEGIAAAVIQHAMADLPPHLSPTFKSFVATALTYDPQQRPSALQLLDHPWVQVHVPNAVRSDSAASLLDTACLKAATKPYWRAPLSAQHQQSSPPAAAASGKPSLSHACSAASLKQQGMQQQAPGSSPACSNTANSSTDGAASLTGSSCSSSALKYSKDHLYYGAGSPCGGPASFSVAAVGGGAGMDACGMYPTGGERLFDRGMTPFANSAAAAAVIGATGGSPFAAVGPQVFGQVQQPWAAGSCAAAHAHAPFGPLAYMPGIPRIGSRQCSLGTHMDWGSTQDSCYTGSPRSMMQRMGLSSSSSLAKQLMPWTSTGSGTLSAAASFNVPGQQGPAAVVAAAVSAAAAAAAANAAAASGGTGDKGASAVPGSGHGGVHIGQQQHPGMGSRSSSWVQSAVGGVPTGGNAAPQQYSQQQGQPAAADAPGASHARGTGVHHSRSSSGGGNSSSSSNVAAATADMGRMHLQQQGAHHAHQHSQHQQPRRQQQQSRGTSLPPAGAAHGSHANTPGVQSGTSPDAAAQAAAAAAAAAAGAQITPLALAVAAAVAEHNKRQPRRWTPFALRVHQLRVAQVLLAERQKQVTGQPQHQQAVGQQQQHPQSPAHQVQAQQRAQAPASPPAQQDGPSTAAGFSPAGLAHAQKLGVSTQQHAGAAGPSAQAATAAAPASPSRYGTAAAGSQQASRQQEQRGMPPTPPADEQAGKEQKPAKKKWLACFVPRALS